MKKYLIIAIVVSLMYFAVWMSLSYPYRLFPSDDDYFQSFIEEFRIRNTLSVIARSHHPVLLISLTACKFLWFIFSSDLSSVLLFHTTLANSVIVFLVALTVLLLTRNAIAGIISMFVYATSAWPVNYSFFYSYTSFSTMLSLASLYLMLKANEARERKDFYTGLAGISCGLYFWSSPAALVMIGLQLLLFLYLFKPLRIKENRRLIEAWGTSFIYTILPFTFLSTPGLIDHIAENIRQQSASSIVRPPLFSFFYIVNTYNCFFAVLFLASCVLLILLRGIKESKLVGYIALLAWLYVLAIDVLPSTKLARTQFTIFPLVIIVTVSTAYFFITRFSPRLKKYMYILYIFLFLGLVAKNIQFCSALIHVKQDTPRYLKAHLIETPLFVLAEDSHADVIMIWLKDFTIQKIMKSEINSTLRQRKKGALLIGPTGPKSGLSILSNCCLDDFYIDDINKYLVGKEFKRVTLPYFAYFPSFMLEEETCMGLFLSGKRVDYKSDSKNITLLSWGESINN